MNKENPALGFSPRMQGRVNIMKSINIIHHFIDLRKNDITL